MPSHGWLELRWNRQRLVKKYVYFKQCCPGTHARAHAHGRARAHHLQHRHGEGGPPSLSLEEDSSDRFPVQR